MPNGKSQSDHVLKLADEILKDVELTDASTDKVALKARRLASLVGNTEIEAWLSYELLGYTNEDLARKYVTLTGRWIDPKSNRAYWGSISQQESGLKGIQAELDTVKSFHPTGQYAFIQLDAQQKKVAEVAAKGSQLTVIISRVRAMIQNFATNVLYERLFSGQAESIFEAYKNEVDALLADRAGEALKKIPHIFDRLSQGDEEAVSQAMVTCRRVMESFTDNIYPPRDGTDRLGDIEVDVGADKSKNRFRVYVARLVSSESRKQRIFKTHQSLYDRTSAGVHDDIELGEAKSIILQTYLLLGEVLSLGAPPEIQFEQPIIESDLLT